MAKGTVTEITWTFNRASGQADIISNGQVLESTTLAQVPSRLAFHRNAAAKASGVTFVEARPRKRGARA
jgi:hypothetical protein